jgi:multicomponent Na+:H+ antiporter subunit G
MLVLLGLAVAALLVLSLFFHTMAIFGVYRLPDVYTRIHSLAHATTLGSIFCVFSVLAYALGRWLLSGEPRFMVLFIHTVIAGIFLWITNPTAIHALARAMHRSGVVPHPASMDHLEDRNKAMKKREGGVES